MIKVFTGPMFSGKSDALLNEYDKRYHKSRILLFKPKMDTRDYGVVKTRKGKEINAILVDDIKDIPGYITDKNFARVICYGRFRYLYCWT